MPSSLFSEQRRGAGGSSLFRSKRKKKQKSLPELQQTVFELEQEQAAFGAPGIEQDRPGVFRTVVDLLSRTNFATAGFVEEVLENKSVTGGLARAMTEMFSGIGSLQGEKRDFGQVMERLGVGTKTLADAFPALDGWWVGNFGSRGALGIGLDIVTDPLTYMTFGGSQAAKLALKVGGKPVVRILNKAGLAKRAEVAADVFNALGPDALTAERRFAKKVFGVSDDFSARRGGSRLADEIDRRTVLALADETGDIAKEFLDPGGIKLFGKSVLPGSAIRGFTEPMVSAISRVPGGESIMRSGAAFRDSIKASVNGMFHPFNELGNLPEAERLLATAKRRDFQNGATALKARMTLEASGLEKQYRKLAAKDPGIGRRWHNVREGVRPLTDLGDEELELYQATMRLYDQGRDTLLAHGVLDPGQVKPGYLFHSYQNLDDLNKYHWTSEAPFSGILSEQFTKQRAFDTFDDAVEESRRLNAIDVAGGNSRQYPILVPEYDVFKNLGKYIELHSDSLARKAWREDILATFGKKIDEFDINALYDVTKPMIPTDSKVFARIERFFENSPTFTSARETAEQVLRVGKDARADIQDAILALETQSFARLSKNKPVTKARRDFINRNRQRGRELADVLRKNGRLEGTDLVEARDIVLSQRALARDLLKSRGRTAFEPEALRPKPSREKAEKFFLRRTEKELKGLDANGKREFLRQLLTRSNSSSQLAAIEKELWGKYQDFFPRSLMQATNDGAVSSQFMAKTLGETAAEMIPVKSAWTGDAGVHLPRAVWDDLQRVNSKLLNTADYKEFGKIVRAFDYANNRFKLFNYTFWPASLVRDVYSNVAQSMLDISVQAMNPKYHKNVIEIMAGREGSTVLNGITYSYDSLRQMSKEFGVWVPGEVFAELAGDTKTAGKFLKKASRLRGLVENEARVLLWYANMRRGLDPRRAADQVAEFLFNYGEVSTVEREFFRRIIPFYTFTRKNVELQWKALKSKPGMSINQVKPFRGRSDENEQMVQWEAEALKLRMDRDGKTVSMITGIDLPIKNLDTLWRGDFKKTGRGIMGMVTPLIKTWPEILLNRDFFLGRDLTRTQSATVGRFIENVPTPQAMKDFLGYKKEVDDAGRPKYTFNGARFTLVFRSWIASRFMSTSDRQFRDNYVDGDLDVSRMMLDLGTGLRSKTIDFDEQNRRKLNNRIRQLEDSLARRGRRAPFRRIYKPKRVEEADFR